jgi:hypothetical protein
MHVHLYVFVSHNIPHTHICIYIYGTTPKTYALHIRYIYGHTRVHLHIVQCYPAKALGGSGAPAASDPAALRAARLAALEKRGA